MDNKVADSTIEKYYMKFYIFQLLMSNKNQSLEFLDILCRQLSGGKVKNQFLTLRILVNIFEFQKGRKVIIYERIRFLISVSLPLY